LRYPASWRTEQAEQDGVWYRYFLGPPLGPQAKPAVSVTLLAGPLGQGQSLDEYSRTYLAGHSLASSRQETRQGLPARSYSFASSDGATRYSLLLLQEGPRVYGLYSQGEARFVEQNTSTLEEMFHSLTLERPASYPEVRNDAFGFSLRLPPSWRESRHFSGGGTLLMQFTSPPLAADKGGETVHASLTLTIEKVTGDLDEFYTASRDRQGAAFRMVSHAPWQGGYVDSLRSETSVSGSGLKRFYRVADGRGYCLSFEARDDVFHRVSRWCDRIAGTLRIGSEAGTR
jgi:hypothetical protein